MLYKTISKAINLVITKLIFKHFYTEVVMSPKSI